MTVAKQQRLVFNPLIPGYTVVVLVASLIRHHAKACCSLGIALLLKQFYENYVMVAMVTMVCIVHFNKLWSNLLRWSVVVGYAWICFNTLCKIGREST